MAKVLEIIARGNRAGQPTPTTGTMEGYLYFVTDEGVTERWSGSAWESYSGAASGDFDTLTTAETDTALVAHPDGAGGVEWGADATGGGGGDPYSNYDITSLSGWTNFGSPDIANVSDFTNRVHLKEAANASVHVVGIYAALPSYPFTVDAFIQDATSLDNNYQRLAGLFIAEASLSGKLHAIHANHDSASDGRSAMALVYYNSITSFNSILTSLDDMGVQRAPIFYRLVAASATDLSWYWSDGGLVWNPLDLNRNPGFTPAAIGVMVDPEQAAHAVEAAIGIYIH